MVISEAVDGSPTNEPAEERERALEVPAAPPAIDRELPGGRRPEPGDAGTSTPASPRAPDAPAPTGLPPGRPREATTDEDPGGQVGG